MAFFAKYIEQVRKLLADNRQQPTEAAREARERFNASLQVNKLEQRRVLNADAVAALTDDVTAAQDSINVGDQGDVIDHALELKDSVDWDTAGIDLNLTLNEHLNEFWAGLGESGEGIANTSSDGQELLAAYAEFINSPEFAEALNGLVTNIFDTYGIDPNAQDPAATSNSTTTAPSEPAQLLDSVQTDVESIIPQHNWGTVEQTTEQLTADILDHVSQHLADNTNPGVPVDSTYHAYAGGIDPQLVVEAVHTQIESLLTAHGIDTAAHQPAANGPMDHSVQQTVSAAHDSVTDAAAMYNASIVESRISELHNEVETNSESTQEQMANAVEQAQEEITSQITNTPVGEALHDTLSQVYDNIGITPLHNWNSTPDQNVSSTAQATTEATTGTEIIFVDSRVTNYQELVDGARDGVEVVVLDSNRDGLEQIAEHLAGREDIAAVHIVSHGSSGQLILGNSIITNENLDQYTAQLNAIGTSLTGNGDILFYGCDVGEGQRGTDFLAAVAAATGADIAASTDDTGAAALGGDWDLEATVGLVNAGNAFTDATQQNYDYILPTVPSSVDLTLSSNTLTINQAGDDQADDITVSYDDTTNELIITDANSTLDATAIAGAGVSGDAGEIRIDLDDFTGTIDTIQINGNGGDDSLRVEASVLAGGFDIDYDGGVGGYDVLTVVGDGTTTSAIYAPDAETFGNGYVAIDANTIDFSNLEPVNITGMGVATVVLPSGDDILSIDNGTEDGNPGQAAVVVTGTSGGVAIESAHFFNNTTILIDTTATDGVDSITVNGADLAASGNTNLVINTGAGADTVDLAGNVVATGDVTITSETINLGADIATAGDVDLNGAIVLTDDVTITANDVTFDGTVDDDAMGGTMSNVVVNADGATIFSDTVGGISAFTSLTTDAAGTTQIDDDITTTNDQTYNDVVGITGVTILTGANITFNDRIVGGDPTAPTDGVGDLTVTASGTTIFESQVGHDGTNARRLVNLTTNGGGTTRSNYASGMGSDRAIDVTGTLQFDDEYIATGNKSFRADTIRFNGIVEGLADGNGAFILNAGTAIEFNDTVGATNRISSIGTGGTATTFLNTTIVHSTNVQTYSTDVEINPAGTGTLQMDSDGNGIIFSGTLRGTNDGEDSLVVTANNVTFGGAVGDNSQRLDDLTATAAVGAININGGSVTTAGDQLYNDTIMLGANTVFTGNDGTFTNGSDANNNDLTLNFAQETIIDAATFPFINVNNFTTGGGGNTRIDTDFTTTGTQTYNDTVTLNDADGNVVLTAENASADPDDNAITFANTVNRDAAAGVSQTLTLDPTGDSISFQGQVGVSVGSILQGIDLTAPAHNVSFDAGVFLGSSLTQQNGTGTTTFNGGLIGGQLDIGSVGTAGTNDVVFNSGTLAVTITVTINAANSITTNASDTTADVSGTTFDLIAGAGGIGSGLAPLDVDATLQLNADTSATGSNIFIDDVNGFPVGQVNAGTGLVALRAGTVITDSLAGEAANITGGAVALSATSGIGTGTGGDVNDIDTVVTGDFAAVTDTGNINISNTGSFTVGVVNGVTGVQVVDPLDANGGGDITLRAASPMVINADVVNNAGGDITEAAEGNVNTMVGTFNAADDDLQINANITATGGNGNINLFAGGDILQTTGTISAAGTGTILLSAGEDFNGGLNQNGNANAEIVMAEAAMITSDTGTITLRATDDITLGQITSNGTVIVTADFDGVGGTLADGTGAINDNAANTNADVTAMTLTLTAGSGIGDVNEIETAVSMLSADTTDGDIDIDNTLTTAVTVTSLTTGNNVAGANIDFDQMGGGDVTFTGDVRSGGTPAAATNGGDITLRNLTAGANLTIDAGTTVTSENGSGGTLSVGGATINGTVTVGAGNITIQGGILDTIIDAVLAGTGAIQVSALRDVIIRDEVSTTSGDITIMADSDDTANADPVLTNNSVRGGVRIEDTGLIDGPAAVTISGSNLYHDDNIEADGVADTTIESVQIDADTVAGTNQVVAAGPIAIRSNTNAQDGATAPADADIIINGRVESTSTSIMPVTAPIRVTANQDVIFNNAAMMADNDGSLNTPGLVIVTATSGAIIDAEAGVEDALITADQAALRAATGIGDGSGGSGDIETATDAGATTFTLAAVTDSGDINIHNTGSVTVGTVDSLVGIRVLDTIDDNSGDDDITLVAASPITVDAPMINMDGGDIVMTAMDPGDVTINADVQVTDEAAMGDDGQIIITAENGNIIHNTGTVSTVGGDNTTTSGQIRYNAEGIGGGAADGGSVTIGDTDTGNAAAEIITVDGNIDIDADPSTLNSTAVTLADANGDVLVQTTTGNIDIDGTGNGTGSDIDGVRIDSGSIVRSTGTGMGLGTITIDGTGGAGDDFNDGVEIIAIGTLVASAGAAIEITGTGGSNMMADSDSNRGVRIADGAAVTAAGTATIDITGTGGAGEDNNHGVEIRGVGADGMMNTVPTTVSVEDGALTITGTGMATNVTTNDNNNVGVLIVGGASVQSTNDGTITIVGDGAAGPAADTNNDGVRISGTGMATNGPTVRSQVTSLNGTISIDGSGNGERNDNDGVQVSDGGEVTSTGTAQIMIEGTGGADGFSDINSNGVLITGTGSEGPSRVMSGAATITIIGSGSGEQESNDGVEINAGAQVTGTGTVQITGTGGAVGNPDEDNDGVRINGMNTMVDGDTVTIMGTGNSTPLWDDSDGVSVTGGAVVSGTTQITITGIGATNTDNDNDGVEISGDDGMGGRSTVTTIDGNINITGTAGVSPDNLDVDNTGVQISNNALVNSDNGNITITGTQGGNTAGSNHDGILIASDADVTAANGTVMLTGTGGSATSTTNNDGVQITGGGTTVMAETVNITGTTMGTATDNDGVEISNGAVITVSNGIDIDGTGAMTGTDDNNGILITGTGTRVTDNSPSPPTIDMDGTGMGTGSDNDGIEISGGAIVEGTDAAMVMLDGTGSTAGTGTDNDGVEISGNDGMGVSSTVSSVNGNITITGTAGDGTDDNTGVEVSNTAQVTSTSANITITGTQGGMPTGDNNDGILIASDADISGTGGTVTLTGLSAGTTAVNENDGVQITGTGTTVMAGTLDIDGTGNGDENDNDGVEISAGAVVTVTGTADIRGTGGSIDAEEDNHGVLITGDDGTGTDTSLSAGTLTIIGSGQGGDRRNVGVEISAEADVTVTGDGALTITGTGIGDFTIDGVLIAGADTTVTAGSADIDGTGTLDGNDSNGDGVQISGGAVVTISGTAMVDGTGTGGEGGNNDGVFINGMNTEFNAGTATIQGTGFAGATGASNDTGVEISGGAAVTIDNAAIINGTGGGDDSEDLNDGVLITGDGTQLTTGNLTITGSGRGLEGENTGVEISNLANVMVTGTAMITGTGRSDGGFDNNDGVRIASDADVTITGTATIIGSGGGDDSDVDNNGVIITGAGTTLEADGLTITGTGDGNETGNDGVEISAGAMVTVAAGIDIDGTGGANGTDNNNGVLISGGDTTVTHTGMTGAIDIDGTSMGDGRLNDGVEISSNALVNSTGTAPIQIDGTGSTNSTDGINRGVDISSAEVRSIDGDVSIIGTGGTGTNISGSSNQGVSISQSDIRIDGMANVIVNGTAGEGTDADGRTTNGIEIFGSTIGDDDATFGAMDVTGDATGYIILDANSDQLEIVQSTIRTNADGDGTIRRILLSGNQIDISNGEGATVIQALSQNGGQGEIVAAPDSGDTVNVQLGMGAVDSIGATDVFGLTDVELNTMEARVVRIGSADILAPGNTPMLTNQNAASVNGGTLSQPYATGTESTITVVGDFTPDSAFATDLLQLRTRDDSNMATTDNISIEGNLNLQTNNPGRHFEAYAGSNITQTNSADITTGTETGMDDSALVDLGVRDGDVHYRAERAINMQSGTSITTIDGEITLAANQQSPATGGGNFDGVTLIDADILTGTGATGGTITIAGRGGDAGSSEGVVMVSTATVTSAGSDGPIDIDGIGRGSDGDGVVIAGAGTLVTSVNGDITIDGTGFGTSDNSKGVEILSGADVTSTGMTGTAANITITGTGGADAGATGNNRGVEITGGGTTVTGIAGDIEITGSSFGDGNGETGVLVSTAANISTTSGAITIDGTSGNGIDGNNGVEINVASTLVTSVDGDIDIDGISNGTGAFNNGVQITNGAQVTSTGMGDPAANITIDGTAGPGTSANRGVLVSTSDAQVTSIDGDITINGTGGADNTNGTSDNDGVAILNSADVNATGDGNITLVGTGNTGTVGDRRDNEGVSISGVGTTVTTVGGDIDVDGTGANGGTDRNEGVNVALGALVGSTTGNITLDGTGGTGQLDNDGVEIANTDTRVTNVLGNITITGTAASNLTDDSDQNRGVEISNGAVVDSTGMDNAMLNETAGAITIIGQGGPGEDENDGVFINGTMTRVSSIDGDITISGTGRQGDILGEDEEDNVGVRIENGAVVESTGMTTNAANIDIDGRGASGDFDNTGVDIDDAGTFVRAVTGNITIDGTGGSNFGDSDDNEGVEIDGGAIVETTGMGMDVGNITITGTGRGDDDNEGVQIQNTGTFVRTVDGDIMITGSSTGFDNDNVGVDIELGAVVRTTGTGDNAGNITIKGKGSGSNSSEGVQIEDMGTIVDVVDGDIMVVGRSEAFGDGNEGVEVQNQARVESTGMGMGAGTITLDGIGTGSNDSEGVQIQDAGTIVTSVDGDIVIRGDSIAANDDNEGVEIENGAVVSSTGMGADAANITIHGFTGVCDDGEGGGVPVNDSEAVLITGVGTTVRAVDGDIEIIGINNSTGIDNAAVEVSDSGLVDATGDGTINIAGLDNNNNFGDPGVLIDGAASTVSSNTGIITITAAALNDNSEPEVAGNLQMDNAGRVLSNEANINLNSTNDVQLGIVDANADNAGAAGTVFVVADAPATFEVPISDFGGEGEGEGGGDAWICMDPAMTETITIDPNGFGAIADNLATEDANITAAATSLVAADGIGAGEHTVDLTTGLPSSTDDNDIDTSVATLAAFNGSNIDGSHNNDGNINVQNHSGALLTLDTVGTTVGVQNQGTGDNDDATTGGDISILNNHALDIGPAGILNDNGGRIIITAASTGALDGDLGILGDVAVTNGIGSIMLNGGDNVDFGPGNTISTDTVGSGIDINAIQGDVRGDFVSAGSTTLIQTAEGTAVRGKPVIISSEVPQIDIFGTTTLTATFGTPGETNLLWTIDWGDGTVEQFVVDAGTHTRSHTYTENPSPNEADPIPVNFDVEHDDSIAVDGFVGQPNPTASDTIDYTINSGFDLAETPGTGFGATVFQFASNSPALSFPETATATGLDNIVETSTLEQIDSGDRVVPGDSTAAEDEKLVLRLTLPSGDTKDFPLPNDILEGDNVKVLWKRLTDGRYQIVLIREDGTERVVLSVEVRGGRAIIRENKPSTDQDSTNNNEEESNQENGEAEANPQNGEAAPDEMSRLELRPTQPTDPIVAPVPVETTATDTAVESKSNIANAAASKTDEQSASVEVDIQERPAVSAAALFGSAIAYRSLRRGSTDHGEWDEQVEAALTKSTERSLGRAARLRRQLLR